MTDRAAAITAFIAENGWDDAKVAPLAGDASNRRYLRLTRPNGSSVLMDAPPERGEDVRPFLDIARFLSKTGLSAPRIIASDADLGLILMEDLGDDLIARIVPGKPNLDNIVYACATDLLAELHDHAPPKDLARYDVPLMADMAALAHEWYLAHTLGPDLQARAATHDAMSRALTLHAPDETVLIQRDYHSENLLWLPQRKGVARIGLLDFQDAMLGHPAYDLVSLLQDARRDVPIEIERAMIDRYVRLSGVEAEQFDAAYHTLGVQRNLRILGVFSRLCLRDGKPHYLSLIPRVWGLLQRDLAHPALTGLAQQINANLPRPTPEILHRLKDRCATIPAQ